MPNTNQMSAVFKKRFFPSAAAEVEAAAPALRDIYAYKSADDMAKAGLALERDRLAYEAKAARDKLAADKASAEKSDDLGKAGLAVSGTVAAHQLGLTAPIIGAAKSALSAIFPSLFPAAAPPVAAALAPAFTPAVVDGIAATIPAVEPAVAGASAVAPVVAGAPAVAAPMFGGTAAAAGSTVPSIGAAVGAILPFLPVAAGTALLGNLLANPVQTGMDVVNDALFGNDDSPWDKAYRSDTLRQDWAEAQAGWDAAKAKGYAVGAAPDYNSIYEQYKKTGKTDKGEYTFFDYNNLPGDFRSYIEEGKAIGKQLGMPTNNVADMFAKPAASYKPATATATEFWDANPAATPKATQFDASSGLELPTAATMANLKGKASAASPAASMLDKVRAAIALT